MATPQHWPAGVVITGEAGIGKTTVWSSALERAREQGIQVLAARADQAESVLAYSAVADMLSKVGDSTLAELPTVQQVALDRVLLRVADGGLVTDQRVVAAAFLAVAHRLARTAPVLLAVDDAQWLDPSSRLVLGFVARRLTGPIAVLATERVDDDVEVATPWLSVGNPDVLTRVRLRPLSLGALHRLIADRLGRSFPRPTMSRIAEMSGGNPFYALELAWHLEKDPSLSRLPASLSTLMARRLAELDDDAGDVLLAAACVAAPTVEVVAQACGTSPAHTVGLLEQAEAAGIVVIEANRLRFTHPLLARHVYTGASAPRRRAMHRALAAVERQPELRARHLALSAVVADKDILATLDAAAETARSRGAPAAAAELLQLARGLGGDTSMRRIRAAGDLFNAGDTQGARELVEPTIDTMRPGVLRAIALNLAAAICFYDNRFTDAERLLKAAVDEAGDAPPVLASTLIWLTFTQGHASFADGSSESGLFDESLQHARRAVSIAEQLGNDATLSEALSMWVAASFEYGHGVDDASLERALQIEDTDSDVALPACASAVHALILAFTGRLDLACERLQSVRRRFADRGAERNLMAVAAYSALFEMWRGDLAEARRLAEEAVERSEQLGGHHVGLIPRTVRAAVAAHLGDDELARSEAQWVLDAAEECGAPRMAEWPLMTLGFLDVSRRAYDSAIGCYDALLRQLAQLPGTEIMIGWYLPDAVEALLGVGRVDDAVWIIERLEREGQRLGRSRMLADAARCRAMWRAALNDLPGAVAAAEQALAEHQGLTMPFEKARTQLLLGQLQRRQRRSDLAAKNLGEAGAAFDAMGAGVWAERAREELSRGRPGRGNQLTDTEARIAELVATGMTNRDVAAALFVSPKTVEAHLGRIYRKLGIRRRVELARRISTAPDTDVAEV